MTLDQLLTFRAVSGATSFRRAADALHLTQPAVSKQIHALESELGEPLFERGRTARLTAAGKMLLKHTEQLACILQNARDEIADLKQLRRGHLSIGASHTLASDALPGLVEKYRGRHPQVTLAIEAGWAAQIIDRVTSHDLDLGLVILVTPKLDNAPELFCTAFAGTDMVFVCSPSTRGEKEKFHLRRIA